MVRIAIASTDGKLVNEHFGRTEQFYIVDTDEDGSEYFLREIRRVPPICRGGDHSEPALRDAVERIQDCNIVLVGRIGARAQNALETAGVEAYEIPGFLEESIDKVIRYKKVEKLFS